MARAMNLYQLARKNIAGSAFRSWAVGLCALLVAAQALGTSLILSGASESLRLATERLGADIIVVPEGSEASVESALLMGNTTRVWMGADTLEKVKTVPGVAAVSPQIYLSTLVGASCCSVSGMFLVAYDPASDFTLEPWLEDTIGEDLRLGEVVGGAYVFVPEGEENIQVYGYLVTLKANLEPTGTALDQSMFMTMETARDVARISQTMAVQPLEIPQDKISSIMVRVKPGLAPEEVALEIMHQVPGVTPIASSNLFQTTRQQMNSLRTSTAATMVMTLALSLVTLGLVFSMATHERRRELGVLRAIGATQAFVFQSLLTEAAMLAGMGGLAGITLTVMVTYLFHNLIVHVLNIPFLLPSAGTLLLPVASGLVLSLAIIAVAAVVPAYRISRMDPADAMRE
jgi:putative ABC transport system permease protein